MRWRGQYNAALVSERPCWLCFDACLPTFCGGLLSLKREENRKATVNSKSRMKSKTPFPIFSPIMRTKSLIFLTLLLYIAHTIFVHMQNNVPSWCERLFRVWSEYVQDISYGQTYVRNGRPPSWVPFCVIICGRKGPVRRSLPFIHVNTSF